MDIKIYYDRKTDSSIITKPAYLVNYESRIVDDFEKISSINTSNDHLTSLEAKSFYYKIDENGVDSTNVQLNGLNNLWLNTKKCLLTK